MKTSIAAAAGASLFGTLAFLLLPAVVSLGEACTSTTTAGSGLGPLGTPGLSDCVECLFDDCLTESVRCESDTDCSELLECVESGGGADSCTAMHPNSACLWEQLDLCHRQSECNTADGGCNDRCSSTVIAACPVTDTPLAACDFTDGGAPVPTVDGGVGISSCDTCAAAQCGAQAAACGPGSPCVELGACNDECTTDACRSLCADAQAYGNAAPQLAAYESCLTTSCSAECNADD